MHSAHHYSAFDYFVGREESKQKNPMLFSDEPGENEVASMFADYDCVYADQIDYNGTVSIHFTILP